MNEQKSKKQSHEESPKNIMGEPAGPVSAWKRVLSKRWVYPAAYVAAAAIILTLVWVYQGVGNKPMESTPASVTESVQQNELNELEGVEEELTTQTSETNQNLAWPVANADEITVVRPFYEKEGSVEEHQAAMVEYKDTFTPNTGIDLAREDDKPFEVQAAMGGTVTRVEEHPLLGYVVEITHANNLKTVYESLTDVKVKQGAEVKQGEQIATAGRSELEKDLGNHVHFAVYENDELVNPVTVLPQN